MDKKVENLDDHGCRKFWDFVDPKSDEETRLCSNFPYMHKTTLHCAEGKANLLGNWTIQQLMF